MLGSAHTRDHDFRTATAVPVTFVSSHAALGGAERYLALLLDHLPSEWVNAVVCLKDGPFAEELSRRGHPVVVIDTGPRAVDFAKAGRQLRRVFSRARPAVVHANGMKAAIVAELAAVGGGPPVIWVKHDFSHDGRLAHAVARRAARVVAVSNAVAETFSGSLRSKVDVLHPQIPEPTVDREAARRLVLQEFGSGELVVVTILVARLDAYKGHRELISAASQIVTRAPEARFLFVGGEDPARPGERAELERAVAEAGLEGVVRFTGHRSDAVELIAGADLLAIPTVVVDGFGKEGFSYVAVEALAVGTPVVGYAHGGPPEVVGDCGVLVPPGDRAALGDALIELVSRPERREELAACGRERFRSRFAWSTLARDLAARYSQVADTKAR